MDSQKKEFTGVWIPKKIIDDESLTTSDMIIYAEIAPYQICYKTNKSLGERWKLKPNTVSKIVSKLVSKGYVFSKKGRDDMRMLSIEITPLLDLNHTPLGLESNPPLDLNTHIENNIDNNKRTIYADKPATKKASAKKESSLKSDYKLINEVIKEMESLDPKNKTSYGNPFQRKACDFLIQEYGFEEVISMIRTIRSARGKVEYLPSITDCAELKNKWQKVVNIAEMQKLKSEKNKSEVIR